MGNLYRLLHQLRGVKNEIVSTFKKSQNDKKERVSETTSEQFLCKIKSDKAGEDNKDTDN